MFIKRFQVLTVLASLTVVARLAFPALAAAAPPKVKMPNPDFTQGEAIPPDAKHDWNLGATGARGKPAMVAVPEMLDLLSQVDPKQDSRGMQQRYFTGALFGARNGLLGHSLENVDRNQLYAAVRAGLKNEDGAARGVFSTVYKNLSAEEIKPLLPAILQAVVESAPSDEMFADGIRLDGLRILAAQYVAEGLTAGVNYLRNQNPWGSEKRTIELTQILVSYGAAAQVFIPELTRIADGFATGEPNASKQSSLNKADTVRAAIREIAASNDRTELIHIL